MSINYSIELFSDTEPLSGNELDIQNPVQSSFVIDDFSSGLHVRTVATEDGLTLSLDKRLLGIIVDQSGSMTWNDSNNDRIEFVRRMLTKLENTYPGSVDVILSKFGGYVIEDSSFIIKLESNTTVSASQYETLKQESMANSIYDFFGVRIVRRPDRYPAHPGDGYVVNEGILTSVADQSLDAENTYYYGIWSFNKNKDYGRGRFISGKTGAATTAGVNSFDVISRVSTGIKRDEYTSLIFNFVEREGFVTYDTSGNGFHGILASNSDHNSFWSGSYSGNIYNTSDEKNLQHGVRFDGQYTLIESDVDNSIDYLSGLQDITISFWIYPYLYSDKQQIVASSYRSLTSNIGWAIGIGTDGEVLVSLSSLGSSLDISTGTFISHSTWTSLSVVIGSYIKVYVNGELDSSTVNPTISTDSSDKLYVGGILLQSGDDWDGNDFFGLMHNFSISRTERSVSFIQSLYSFEQAIFSQSIIDEINSKTDNLDRETITKWSISDPAIDQIKIVRKYHDIPSSADDGDVVCNQSASVGEFEYLDTYDFIHGGKYYYRIFTYNSEKQCHISNARVASTAIPPNLIDNEKPDPVSDLTVAVGDRKVLLQWENPDNISGIKVYYSPTGYPSISKNGATGFLIADTTLEFFVHRSLGKSSSGVDIPLKNNYPYYYSVVAYNKYGEVSSESSILAYPEESDNNFPPEEVSQLSIETIGGTSLLLKWNNPSTRSELLNLYFNDTAVVFTDIKDQFGNQIPDIDNINYEFYTEVKERSLSKTSVELGEVPDTDSGYTNAFSGSFPDSQNTQQAIDETLFTYGKLSSGIIYGTISPTKISSVLRNRESYEMYIRAFYRVQDESSAEVFRFNSKPVTVKFTNPLRMSIRNKLGKTVIPISGEAAPKGNEPCKCDNESGGSTSADPIAGAYVGSKKPYVARIEIQYKGESVPDGYPVAVRLFAENGFDSNSKPTHVQFVDQTYYTSTFTSDSESNSFTKSYIDVSIPIPSKPETVDLYASINFDGIICDCLHTVTFLSSLRISVNITKPIADGIDVGEQFATVWIVDPDDPQNESKRKVPPDNTMIKWTLIKKRFGRERPFYSSSTTSSLLTGVYSPLVKGVARNVFFGPVSDLQKHIVTVECDGIPEECCISEEYAIKAEVFYNSMSAVDTYNFYYDCETDEVFSNKRLLVNADPNWRQTFGNNPEWITWGDGVHMLKFQISKSPVLSAENSDILGAQCFVDCISSITQNSPDEGIFFDLPVGQIIEIQADGEILWDVTYDEDPYTGEITLVDYKISDREAVTNIARIPITGDVTDFYIRRNTIVTSDPKRKEIDKQTQNDSTEDDILPNEWRGKCYDKTQSCFPVKGIKWDGVTPVRAKTTVLINGKSVTLVGGGSYEDGLPPVLIGFKEPLSVTIIEARTSHRRVGLIRNKSGNLYLPVEDIADGVSYITFVVEVNFSGVSVPESVPVEVHISGNKEIVRLSNCVGTSQQCSLSSSGIVYTQIVNDPYINPDPNNAGVEKKSLAYFTINPLPANTSVSVNQSDNSANATISVYAVYDKRGDAK